MPPPTVIVKKYENRRLYDSSNSRYVNLDDIAQMVREGVDIQVIDAATGEDLTRLVLTQIIVESAKITDSPFPIDMLRQMIIASGRLSQEGMRAYMNTMLDLYESTYGAFTGIRRPGKSSSPNASASSAPDETTSDGSNFASSSVDDLRRRIEDLEDRLAKRTPGRVATKRAGRSRPKT